MANKGGTPENLHPVRSSEEAKELGRKGGIASGKARRAKRDSKEAARLILDLPVSGPNESNLKALGIDEEDFSNRVALFARAYVKAMAGDINAMRFLVEIAGETPSQMIAQERFEMEKENGAGVNDAIDDWVNSIPDLVFEDEETDQTDE